MKRLLATLSLCAMILAGCSCNEITDTKVTKRVRDKSAYQLGETHAAEVIKIQDETDMQDALLEVRARISNISAQLSPQSGADYERGFTDYIRAHSDSLAQELF